MHIDYENRSVPVTLLGESHRLYVSNKVMREVSLRYGSEEDFFNVLTGDVQEVAGELLWILVTMANSAIAAENINNPQKRREYLDLAHLDLNLDTNEFITSIALIGEALELYHKRDITDAGEDSSKNLKGG